MFPFPNIIICLIRFVLCMDSFSLESNEKYGLVVLPSILISDHLPNDYQLSSDLWISRNAPFGVPRQWREWMGSLKIKDIEKASLFLLTKKPSKHPDHLDEDNEICKKRVGQFYWGLLLTGFVNCYEKPLLLTGAKLGGSVDVRQFGEFNLPRLPIGLPPENIKIERLCEAALVANLLPSLEGPERFDRFSRILHSYYAGLLDHNPVNSLYQFVRCIEGFIYPEKGKTTKQFSSRTSIFLGPGHHSLATQLYDMKSSIEHLHDPFRDIKGGTEKKKRLILFQRSIEAEAIARFCIKRVLTGEGVQEWFENDERLIEFWKLDTGKRQRIWGPPMAITNISSQFREDLVTDMDLGL